MKRTKPQLSLSTFDDQLLDGLGFCRKVYDLFDQVRSGTDGIAKLRLRPTKTEKRLILPSEWDDAIEQVTKAQAHLAFREVFLVEMVMSHSATLYGDQQ